MSAANEESGNNLQRPLAGGIIPEQEVVKTERRWFWTVRAALGIIVVVITVTAATNHLHPPSNSQTIDPALVYQSREFSETNLGTAIEPDGTAVVRFIAQQYSFVPHCVTLPADTPVVFRLTSADVIHGFLVADTNINTMVVPGYISEVRSSFKTPGDYVMPCHEFCGIGHAGMAARVRVVSRESFPLLSATERLRCATK